MGKVYARLAKASKIICAAPQTKTPGKPGFNVLKLKDLISIQSLALARLEALLGLVDDIDAALAADQLIVAMACTQRLERITDFHRISRLKRWLAEWAAKDGGSMPHFLQAINRQMANLANFAQLVEFRPFWFLFAPEVACE